jgi:5'-3' exoribonuclease 1
MLSQEKLEISYDEPAELGALVYRYIEGLQWVLNYYYKGVSSWAWFYDYHFSPRITGKSSFAEVALTEDLVNISDLKFEFELGRPFRPFEQLMGVLPTDSMEHVPSAYRVSLLVGGTIKVLMLRRI